jgi:hypothetical protein
MLCPSMFDSAAGQLSPTADVRALFYHRPKTSGSFLCAADSLEYL